MTTTRNTSYEDMARQSLKEDSHYAPMVTEMADQKEVIASEDIYAANGTKLISKNTIIGGGLREGLLKHKLLQPIDLSLMVQNGVTAESLAREAARLTEEDSNLQYLVASLGDPQALPQRLAHLPLSPQMAFKLTVAREQHPHLFHHLLLVTLIAHYLAVRGKLPENDLAKLLCAALFHDLGELHTDPALLNSRHHLSEIEWHHIYAHPITGYLIAREASGIDSAVSIAILQHHERLDGSGYPYGLRGARIGTLARIISVADVCASIFARFGSSERLNTLMRLNRQKYEPELLAFVHEGFGPPAKYALVADIAALPRLTAVAQLLETWGELCAALSGAGGNGPPGELEFLFERMVNLRSLLLQFGFDPDNLQLLVGLATTDPQVANELAAALDELHWQFTDLERETSRRRETIRATLTADENRLLDGWIEELLAYLAAT